MEFTHAHPVPKPSSSRWPPAHGRQRQESGTEVRGPLTTPLHPPPLQTREYWQGVAREKTNPATRDT
eukprot:8471616-Pyramimonas_sp.AAC.1